MMMSALYLTNSLSCIFIVLAHKCKHNSPVGRHGVQLEHIVLILSQQVFALTS